MTAVPLSVIVPTMARSRTILPLLALLALSLACNFPSLLSQDPPVPTPTTAAPTETRVPTPTVTPTPTATPTPLPEARIATGDQALFQGDWDHAQAEFQSVMANEAEPEDHAAALLGLGRTHYLENNYEQAQATLEQLIAEFPDSDQLPQVYFFLGRLYSASESYADAAEAYGQYLELRPGVIDSYVHELRGDALAASGDYEAAIVAYQAAVGAPHVSTNLITEVKIAEAYAALEDYQTAIVGYQDIYARTANDITRAQMDYRIGQAYTQLGDMEAAYAAYQDAVNNYPGFYEAYLSLVELVDAGITVDEFQRGLVDYYAGQYSVAVQAFDRYLQAEPEDPGRAVYFKGLATRALGGHGEAIEIWQGMIEAYPDHDLWDDAWEQVAFTQWFNLEEYRFAIDTLVEFVETAPAHGRAAELLFEAGEIAERFELLPRAAALWDRVGREFPQSRAAYRALFLAGITRYRLEEFAAAHETFERAELVSPNLEARSAAYLWRGKAAEALNETETARGLWEQAASLDATGYYSERARDILSGREPFTPPQEYDLAFDLEAERLEAVNWMRTVFSLPEDVNLSGLGELAGDARVIRGNEFWELGLYEQARIEFEDLRAEVAGDPADTFRLTGYLVELGLYRPAIFAARQVLSLAGMDDAETMAAPIYFNHIRFGPYYRDLVIQAAQEYNFHPLLLFSIIRQESLFEGFALSSAGANGLMQIIPSTGQEIANNLDWPPDYTTEDLNRPVVSIQFGSEYLRTQQSYLDSGLYPALAAYNGGPGNALAWMELAPDDPDLFLEVIRFEETRNYIRGIYEIFNIYRQIYDRTP